MIQFPQIHPDTLFAPDAREQRAKWLRAVVEQTREWLMKDEDILEWMETYRALRANLLKLAWAKMIPLPYRDHASYILFGSGARSEDLLYSDVDHAILLHEPVELSDFHPHLLQFLGIMNEFGLPPCEGFVMGNNPRWIGMPALWKERIEDYFNFPDWDNVRFLFMIVDARPLHEPLPIWTEIREQVVSGIQRSPFICWEMAHLGIHRSVALGIFGRLKSKKDKESELLNVKEGLINPIVHSLRLLSVKSGSRELSSLRRHDNLLQEGILQDQWGNTITETLKYGWRMRLKARVQELFHQKQVTDTIDVSDFTKKEKEELMEHLEVAKRLERWTHRQFRKPR